MAVKVVDSVVETTQTTGTGTLDLDGAQTGFRSFAEELTSGDQVYYCIEDDPSSPTAYEIGIGTFTAGSPNTLSRDTVLKSSNAGNKLNLVSGGYTVTGVLPAKALNDIVASLALYALLGSANTFTANQTIRSSDAGAGVGPTLTLDRNSASPAAADLLGRIAFNGRDSGGNVESYGAVTGLIIDPTAASEDGRLDFDTVVAGTAATRMSLGAGLAMAGATGGDKGAGTINAKALYIEGNPVGKGTPLVLNPYTVNTTVTQAHGLGVEPSFLRVVLECLSSEGGYSTGDRIIVSAAMDAENASVPAFRVKADGTNLVLVTHQSGRPNIVHGSSRDNFAITAANWKLEITPYLVG